MRLYLTNKAGISLSLSNDFLPSLNWEIDDFQASDSEMLECVNRNAKYWRKREIEYSSKTKNVFKNTDSLGNTDYLIVRF